MTLDSIAAELPNGFHDAHLRFLAIDYVSQRATLAMRVWVGDAHAPTEAEQEAYRPVALTIGGLVWCIIESPDAVADGTGDELWIDAGPVSDLENKPALPSVPDGAFAWWIFVRQWNAFMYVAGTEASIAQ